MSVRAVVFDLDDTLYLERDYVRSGFRAVGAWYRQMRGDSRFAEVAWRLFSSGVRGSTFDRALVETGEQPTTELVRRMVERYRDHVPDVALAEDAELVLERLRGEFKLGLISDGPRPSQRRKLDALGLEHRLDAILLTEEMGPEFRKPSTLAFEAMEKKLDTPGDECVYVADNPTKDFKGPVHRHWRTVRIRRPLGLYCDIASASDVGAEIPDLLELPQMLRAWM